MNVRPALAVLLLSLAVACTPKPKVDEAAAFDVIQKNIDAMQREDIVAVMATIYPGPEVEGSRKLFESIFAQFDLAYEVSDLKVVSATDEEVKVSYVQKTLHKGGEPLPDNIAEGVHTLRKDGGVWKLARTATVRYTPLIRPATPTTPSPTTPAAPTTPTAQ